jgi:hypothetical protein
MIEIPRALARQFRAVLRRCLAAQEARVAWPLVLCRAGKDGLTLQARLGDIAVRYRLPGEWPAEALVFRASVLAEVEGTTAAPVALGTVTDGKAVARWDDDGVPRELELETVTPDSLPPFPELPERLAPLPDVFLRAFQEACVTAAKESVRFAVSRVQLRGRRGEVVGTDGRQLLLWGGFRFPWKEDVLLPRLPVFGHRDIALSGPVVIGRTDTDVALRVGPWTFALAIDATSRYPQVDRVVPAEAGVTARLRLHPEDAALLQQALPKLPGRENDHSPVTLELSSAVSVRARSGDGPVSELPLARSEATGKPVRLCTDRTYLRRAAQLGFTELQVTGPSQPVCCRDAQRLYLWVPLSAEVAIPPGPVATAAMPPAPKAASDKAADDKQPDSVHSPERRKPMAAPSPNGRGRPDDRPEAQPPRGGIEELIAEAEALRGLLHDVTARTARLVAALKQQRRQARAVAAAMASLRQLPLHP